MPRDKALIEKLLNIREILKSLLFIFASMLIGLATLIYQVMNGNVGIYMLFLLVGGLIALGLNASFIYAVWTKSEKIIEELENV